MNGRHRISAACTLLAIALSPVQGTAQVVDSGVAIAQSDIASHLARLTDGSASGRTSGAGLDSIARYIADQFQMAGLKPLTELGDRVAAFQSSNAPLSTWFQRYPLSLDRARSSLTFVVGQRRATVALAAAVVSDNRLPKRPLQASVILVAGRATTEQLKPFRLDDKIVLYFPLGKRDTDTRQMASTLIQQSGGLVYLHDEDPNVFTRTVRSTSKVPLVRGDSPRWALSLRAASVPGVEEVLAAAGVDLARLRTDTAVVVREIPSLQILVDGVGYDAGAETGDTLSVPNVIGVLDGTDSILKNEYVLISALMGRGGAGNALGDSGRREAVEPSGAAAVMALAKAFGRSAVRPRRSIIFLVASGQTPPFEGNRAFASGWMQQGFLGFTLDSLLISVVAALDLDRLNNAGGDSLRVDGVKEVDFGAPVPWVAAAHPDLGLTILDGGTVFRREWGAFVFAAERAVPTLAFHGYSRDLFSRNDTVPSGPANLGQITRATRFAYYVARETADVSRTPRWTAEGRNQILREVDQVPMP